MSSTLFYNAKIYSVNNTFDIFKYMLVDNGIIKYIGNEIPTESIEIIDKIDCEGVTIYPGFIDPHCHFIDLGKTYFTAKLHDAKSLDAVIDICLEFQKTNESSWLLGRGWNQNNWSDKKIPTKELLDKYFPDIPVLLIRIDSHMALVNQKAIELTDLLNTPFIDSGEIEINNNIPTGIILDKALYHVLEYVKPDIATKTQYIQKSTDVCFSYGLTSIGDAFMTYEDFLLYSKMNGNNELRINVYGMLVPSIENKNYLTQNGIYNTNKLHIHAVKHFADGALGSRGAALIEPYTDASENYGMLLESDEYWEIEAQFCIDNNLQMVTHAIGDAANKRIINLYSKYLGKSKNPLRWRIEHLQMIDEEDIENIKESYIVPSIQSTHGTSDYTWAPSRIGEERMKKSYRIKDILDACGYIVNGSDFPIEKPNPLRGFYSSVSRKDDNKKPENGFAPEQKISRTDALKSMTIWSAYAQFEEQLKGSLEIGKVADFVILDKDIMICEEDEILDVKVKSTYINGIKVY